MLGGYRIVRKLGTGSRAEVWLGSDGASTAAIKVFGAQVEPASIDAEIEALGLAHGRHVVRLEDLASGPEGMPCLIFPRLSGFSLSRLISERRLTHGEAVTILAPLALTLAELHESGIAHRSVTSHAVLFDEAGAPILTSFGRADIFASSAPASYPKKLPRAVIAESASVAADVADMASLCRSVLGDAGDDLLRRLGEETSRPGEFLTELADRLFSLAAPAPVSLGRSAPEKDPLGVSSRVDFALDAGSPGQTQELQHRGSEEVVRGSEQGAVSGPLALFHLPEPFVNAVRAWLDKADSVRTVSGLWGRVISVLRPVRMPVWIIAGAVVVAIVTFAALVPAQSSSHPPATGTGNAVAAVTEENSGVSHAPSGDPLRSRPEILGDDPIAAGKALLAARYVCLETQSVLCLDGVNQPGSASMEADNYRIRLLQAGGIADSSLDVLNELGASGAGAVSLELVDSLGDSVLFAVEHEFAVSLAPKVTMLIVRGDQGWRIRDLVVSDPEH